MSVLEAAGRAIDVQRLTFMRISSHIKGKPSHKIVSDGKFFFLKFRFDLEAVVFLAFL